MESGSGFSGFQATSPEDRDAILRLTHHYDHLRREVHLPHLDTILLDKYLIKPLLEFAENPEGSITLHPSEKLGGGGEPEEFRRFATVQEAKAARDGALHKVVTLVTIFTDHKQRTLEVLEAVTKRDTAWKALLTALESCPGENDAGADEGRGDGAAGEGIAGESEAFGSRTSTGERGARGRGSSPTAGVAHTTTLTTTTGAAGPSPLWLEVSAIVQHHLYQVQRASLSVVERVQAWREGLSLPHPFMVGAENYLLRMLADTARLAADKRMEKVVPMQSLFMTYPLCSNLPSLSRFAEDPAKPKSAASFRLASSLGPVADPTFTKRLAAAEKVLLDEVEAQINVLRQLLDLCSRNRFMPVLQLKKLYPQAYALVSSSSSSSSGGGAIAVGHAAGPSGAVSGHVPRGVPLASGALQQKLEATLLHSLDALRNPPFRAAYEEAVGHKTAAR